MIDTSTGWTNPDRGGDAFGVERPAASEALESSVTRGSPTVPDERSAYHYRTEQEMELKALARLVPGLRRHASGLPNATVCFVRTTSRVGLPVRVPPRAVPEILFLDHMDLATLKAGLDVPALDHAIATLRAFAARA